MSVLSVSSNAASVPTDSIIAALREGVEAGLLVENFQIYYSGGGNFYNVDARVKGVSTFFSTYFQFIVLLYFFFGQGYYALERSKNGGPASAIEDSATRRVFYGWTLAEGVEDEVFLTLLARILPAKVAVRVVKRSPVSGGAKAAKESPAKAAEDDTADA